MAKPCCVQDCVENLNAWIIFLKLPLAHFLLQLDSFVLVWQRGLKSHDIANLNSRQKIAHTKCYLTSILRGVGIWKTQESKLFLFVAGWRCTTTRMWRTKLWRTRSAFMGKSWMETGAIVKGFHRTPELSQLINTLKSIEVGVVSSHLL